MLTVGIGFMTRRVGTFSRSWDPMSFQYQIRSPCEMSCCVHYHFLKVEWNVSWRMLRQFRALRRTRALSRPTMWRNSKAVILTDDVRADFSAIREMFRVSKGGRFYEEPVLGDFRFECGGYRRITIGRRLLVGNGKDMHSDWFVLVVPITG